MTTISTRLARLEAVHLPKAPPTEIWMHFEDGSVEHVTTGRRLTRAEFGRRHPTAAGVKKATRG